MSEHSRQWWRERVCMALRCRMGWIAVLLLALAVILQYARLALTGLILGRGDPLLYFYPYWSYRAEALRTGRLPLWNPILFGGVPFLANSQAGVLYPPNWLLIPFDAPAAVKVALLAHVALAAGLMALFSRRSLGFGWAGAWTAAVLFALGGYMTAQVEHVNQIQGLAWLPGLFLLFDQACQARGRRALCNGAGLALVIGLQLLAGHTQSAFISWVALGLYALWYSAGHSQERFRPWLVLLLALIAGATLAAGQLLPSLELSRLSTRAGGLPVNEALSFSLDPLLLGRALLPGIGQAMFPEYIAFPGVIALVLAVFGIPERRELLPWSAGDSSSRPTGALLLLAAIGLFFAFGLFNPLYGLLVRFIPGFNLFRVPARWLVLFTFGIAGLAGNGLDRLAAGHFAGRWGGRRLAIAILIVLGLAGAAVGGALLAVRLRLSTSGDEVATSSLAGWVIALLVAASLVSARLRGRLSGSLFAGLACGLVLAELVVAGQALPQNYLTAPQAWSSWRPAVAHLLAAGQTGEPGASPSNPPDRFLSSSQLVFDPGDLSELRTLYGRDLSPQDTYDLVVASKLKEVLSPNLPLHWQVPTFDGYDGGLLPLARWVAMADALGLRQPAPDGRLRETLAGFPPSHLLSLLNVRYFLTDRVGDDWQGGVFYDLGHPIRLDTATSQAQIAEIPQLESTALGLISHLENASQVPEGQVVAEAEVTFPVGSTGVTTMTIPIRVGIETAESPYPPDARHHQPSLAWPDRPEYAARLSWGTPARIPLRISVRSRLTAGRLVVGGLALIDERTGAFEDMTVSTEGRWRLAYAGDVKIYENLDTLPRAYLVSKSRVVDNDAAARTALLDPGFDPAREVILIAPDAPAVSTQTVSQKTSTVESGGHPLWPVVRQYGPEHAEIDTDAPVDSFLVLSDSFYPGWQASVDGQPVPIYRANVLFRAVTVPAGQHRVAFNYQPMTVRLGLSVSALALLAILAGLTVGSTRRSSSPRP